MLVAKVIAFIGLVLFIGGASETLGITSLAAGSVLLAVAATVGAVALESRDLQDAAGLVPHPDDETDAAVIQLARPTGQQAA